MQSANLQCSELFYTISHIWSLLLRKLLDNQNKWLPSCKSVDSKQKYTFLVWQSHHWKLLWKVYIKHHIIQCKLRCDKNTKNKAYVIHSGIKYNVLSEMSWRHQKRGVACWDVAGFSLHWQNYLSLYCLQHPIEYGCQASFSAHVLFCCDQCLKQ